MGQRTDNVTTEGKDTLVWLIVVILVAAGVVANYYFSELAWGLRATGILLLAILVGFIGAQTVQGGQILAFAKESRTELRKVAWPTRQETIQSTFMVVVMVIITALLLWAIDSVLMWIIAKFTV